jgi:hypothetical protein
MGLDISAGTKDWHASYSGVQMHRIQCLLAFAKVLKDNFPEARETMRRVVDCLPDGMDKMVREDEGSIDGLLGGNLAYPKTMMRVGGMSFERCIPNYDHVDELKPCGDTPGVAKEAMRGLRAWVNHSDCDGTHGPGTAAKVLAMLNFVATSLPQGEPWDKKWQEGLRSLYSHASKKGLTVSFH